MSTNIYVDAGSLLHARPSGGVLSRRKADAMESANQAEDEFARPAKRCKRSQEAAEQIDRCFAKLSLQCSGKARARDEGKAVRLRKRFVKSLRNIPAQPDSIGGGQFAFTFSPKPFAPRIDNMEDIKVSCATTDLALVSQTKQVIVSPQYPRFPMSIDDPQDVEPVGSSEASTSISTIDTEMEFASEHVLALDVAASSPREEDKVMADAPHIAVPTGIKSFVSRFLARAPAAVPRQAVRLASAVRGFGKSSSRKISPAASPYARTCRSQALRTASRASGSLMVPDNMFCRLASTTERVAADIVAPTPAKNLPSTSAVRKTLFLNEDIVTPTREDAAIGVLVEIREGSPALVNVINCLALGEPLADVQVTTEVMEVEVFHDAFEEVKDEVMREGDEFFSLPPSPSPSSPQLFSATADYHNCDNDRCIACLLLTNLVQAPNSPPSLCDMDSEESSTYASETDAFPVDSVPYSVVADPAIWLFREPWVLPDLEDDVVAIVPVEEIPETEIIPEVSDLQVRFGSLVSHLDKSCKDSACAVPATSYPDVLMSSDSEMWYDAMDVVSPAVSLGDIRMACDASFTDTMDGILFDYARCSAPLSPVLSAIGLLAELDSAIGSHPHATIHDFDMTALVGSPFDPICAASFLVSTPPRPTADPLQPGTDACFGSFMDLDIASTQGVLTHGLGYITPAQPFCSSWHPEDDSALVMLEDTPSMDLMDICVSRLPAPVPAHVFPGAWRENFEPMDDIFS